MPGRQIDDAQPPVAECRTAVHVEAGVVRATMREDVPHRLGASSIFAVERVTCNDACYAAHVF